MCVLIKHLYPMSQLPTLKMTWNFLVFPIPDSRCALPFPVAKDPTQSIVCVPDKHFQIHCFPGSSDVTLEGSNFY